ncbi:MAG: hypothetical protein WA101_01605 [Minisyncoccia bacterium]
MKYFIFTIVLFSFLTFIPGFSLAQSIPFDQSQNVPFVQNQNQGVPFVYTPPSNQTSSTSGLCTLVAHPRLGDLLKYITCIISSSVVPLIFALAIASFIWGVVQYVINNDDEAKKAKGRSFMIWGIIALTVMVSVWGLVKILGTTFGLENAVPQVNTTNQQ